MRVQKLNLELAREIRTKHSQGKSMKELAKEYGVTFASISRIVHNLTYPEKVEDAKISVIYNLDVTL